MVEALSGGRWQGSTALVTTPPQTSWKELGRTTLGSAGDSINVASFAAKDNLMILTHAIESGVIIPSYQFNADTNDNYIIRASINGGSDFTGNAANKIQWSNAGTADTNFGVGEIVNVAAQEKLAIISSVKSDTGNSNAPNREETVGKWANTSNQITTVNVMNTQSGDFASGSEVVVLGMDNDEANSGTNFWQELNRTELSSSADTITTGATSAISKKYLWVRAVLIADGNIRTDIRLNNDSNGNYTRRRSNNGASDSTATGESSIDVYGDDEQNKIVEFFIVNVADKEKMVIGDIYMSNSSGSNNAPNRCEFVAKWSNTSDLISRVTVNNTGASGSYAAGSYIQVWGSD